MNLQNYQNIIDSSTENFQGRHLISNEAKRRNLLKSCKARLGKRNKCRKKQYDANVGDAFAKDVIAACGPIALDRLQSLKRQGLFPTNAQSGFDNLHVSYWESFSNTNTMIVHYDDNETVLLHIRKGNSCDLRFIIEKKRSLDLRCNNLGWEDGKISHYQS